MRHSSTVRPKVAASAKGGLVEMKQSILQVGPKPVTMFEEPDWAQDKDVWKKAKDQAGKSKSEDSHALATHLYKKMGGKVGKKKSESPKEGSDNTTPILPNAIPASGSADDIANAILTGNPNISAPTFLNTLRSQGVILAKREPATEADSASSNAASIRAGVHKERTTVPVGQMNIRSAVKMIEGAKSDNGIGAVAFQVVIIQEGLGNLKDGFYYTKECLKNSITHFEGKKIYADHPSSQEEEVRPERSVRDILGYFENVKYEEAEGRGQLTASVRLMDEAPYSWARGLMRYAVDFSKKFPDKEFVGLSINASGDAEEKPVEDFMKEYQVPESAMVKLQSAVSQGLGSVRVVNLITDAISCDLVTEAGAGGKVLSMIEQEKLMKKQVNLDLSDEQNPKIKEAELPKEEPKEEPKAEPKAEPKEEPKKEEAAPEAPAAASADPGHDDAAQDIELMKKVLKQYFGDQADSLDESDDAMMKQAMEEYKSIGMEGEECMKMAAASVKLKKAKAAKEAEEPKAEPKEEPKMESNKEIIKLSGENAALKESLKGYKLNEHLDKVLKESKLNRQSTDQFRKIIGDVKKIRDEKQIDAEFKMFMEGHKAAQGELSDVGGLTIMLEKASSSEATKFDVTACLVD